MKKIAFILYTSGLEYDDRVRKEALALSKYGGVEIFVLTPENNNQEGTTSYGIPYKSFTLKTRKHLPSGRFTLLKGVNFFFSVKKYLKQFDILWVHDVEPFLVALLFKNKRVVWDLHETPMFFLKNKITRAIFKRIEVNCDALIHANPHRLEFLTEMTMVNDRSKHFVLRNFPDQALLNSNEDDSIFADFKAWLKGSEYAYIQGLVDHERLPEETIETIMQQGEYKAVVIGGFDEKIKHKLYIKYGSLLFETIFFRGKVNQLQIPRYVKGSKFSLVFYTTETPNARFCEPNRMYQAIALGKPVVLGCNEPMKSLVEKYGFGVVTSSDGRCVAENVFSLNKMLGNYQEYASNIIKNKHKIFWEEQLPMFVEILNYIDQNK